MFYWLTGELATLATAAIGIYATQGAIRQIPASPVDNRMAPADDAETDAETEADSVPEPEPEPERAAGTIMMPRGYGAYVYEAQFLGTPIVAQLPAGTSASIICTVQGDTVTSNGSTSSLWNRIDQGYVPDVNVNTGTRQATMPTCS
ncbi:hypothetical protein AB0L44_47150 [Nonomuraea wenchangensis]|uniref:hypothetical protein n=1 Tax=Nonomuraea wenchangensis TaxID=568860 RepID=UPI0034220C79